MLTLILKKKFSNLMMFQFLDLRKTTLPIFFIKLLLPKLTLNLSIYLQVKKEQEKQVIVFIAPLLKGLFRIKLIRTKYQYQKNI